MSEPTAAILRRAATLIRRQGWWHTGDTTQGYDNRLCLMMAIEEAARPMPIRLECATLIHEATGGIGAVAFNDAPGTTKEDVLAALEQAAQRAEREP